MTVLLAFCAIIVIAVFVHEMGHYIAARFFGVRVLRFSVGFGPPLLRRTDKHGTEWVLAPLPLGGYVQMLDGETAKQGSLKYNESLDGKNNFQRFIVYAAGPFANLVLTAFLAAGLAMHGEIGLKPQIGKVVAGGAAEQTGARRGDIIDTINGKPVVLWRQAAEEMASAVIGGEDIRWTTASGGRHSIPAGRVEVGQLDEGLFAALGMFPDRSYISPKAATVIGGGAADKAGMLQGDIVVLIGDDVIDDWSDLRAAVAKRPGQTVPLVIWRAGAEVPEMRLTATIGGRLRGGRREGVLGVAPTLLPDKLAKMQATLRLGLFPALAAGADKSTRYVANTFAALRHIVIGNISPDNLSGPIGIAMHAGAAARGGLAEFLQFLAFISASLAAINLLPLPLLDGGQMVVCIIQAARRKPLPPGVVAALGKAGGALLLTLMLGVIINDILKLWGG
ncbi:MAG: RIP metalloprotease RseP [Gammaproteobacteria bacterium]